MKLTRKAEYGIRAVLYLSIKNDSENKKALTKEIAKEMKIPKQFLAQVMFTMSKAGIVKALRGANGGFVLAKEPINITLKDVIQTIEGNIGLNECLIDKDYCERSSWCPMHDTWIEAQESMLNVLDKQNFKILAQEFSHKKQMKLVANN